jgi:hypothetical protein
MVTDEVKEIARDIVRKAKATARVDQGTLKRSIAVTFPKDRVEFRQIFYGDYNENSQLEALAREFMPRGVEYRVILTTLGGGTYEAKRTKQGRASKKKTSLLDAVVTTANIRNLINRVRGKKKE